MTAWLRGLRPRLVLAFVVVALVSAAAASAASYQQARSAIVADAQNTVLAETLSKVSTSLPALGYPPNQARLDAFAQRLPSGVLVVYGNLQAHSGAAAPTIPADVRAQVHERHRLLYRRVLVDGVPFLAFGTTLTTVDGRPSGVEIYGLADLSSSQERINELAWSTGSVAALSLLPAVVLALLAAGGVLRPVRNLRRAATLLAAGELATRLPVRGRDELADLVRTFNDTAAELERAVGRLRRMEADARRFAADVSHELRTPLAAMTAVLQTLDDSADRLGGDAARAVRLVGSETRRLAVLVENLVDISRFDAGDARLRLDGPVDLAAAVTATLAARGWRDRVEADLPVGVTVEVDRRRLDVMVANLVGNALRHGAPPVRVAVTTWTDTHEREWFAISVTDAGPGLRPDVLPHVFDRFYKGDAARAQSEGSGLGLTIALENARLHGGSIEAENAAGGGATFRLVLPGRPEGQS